MLMTRFDKEEFIAEGIQDVDLRFFYLLSLLKMFRLIGIKGRVRLLIESSEWVSGLWTSFNIEKLKFIEFAFWVVLLTHWLGCIWGVIAFLEVGSFNQDDMLNSPNWMGHW